MTGNWAKETGSVTWRYVALGAAFGMCFPLAAMGMLLFSGAVSGSASAVEIIVATHAHSPLLLIIYTAPIFLGLFAGFAGVRQSRLLALNDSLEQQVAGKTASLRDALQRAEKTNILISHMADHDPLTGLLNRRRMHKELVVAVAHARRYGEPFALVFVDLDRFKAINDNHGHEAGDRLLSGLATQMEHAARESDKLGRWGGDEFVALLPHCTRPGAQQFAARLQERLGRHSIDIGAAQIAASASIGIAVHPEDGTDPETLLAHADEDMYRVKRERDCKARPTAHA